MVLFVLIGLLVVVSNPILQILIAIPALLLGIMLKRHVAAVKRVQFYVR